ncbi:MAG: hypothetical protein ACRELF_28270, partial [Gemmataceae bacterium]
MSLLPRTCPDCRANLTSARVGQSGKLRCPQCGAVVATRSTDADYRLQTAPIAGRPIVRSPRAEDVAEVLPVHAKRNGVPIVLIVLVVGLGGVLVLAGGIVGMIWYFGTTSQVASPWAEIPIPEGGDVVIVEHPQPPPQAPIQPAAQAGKGPLPLKELKAASVYVKVQAAGRSASGSGFVVHAQGDTVCIATNHHVVNPPPPQVNVQPNPLFPNPVLPGGNRGMGIRGMGIRGMGIRGMGIRGMPGMPPVMPGMPPGQI